MNPSTMFKLTYGLFVITAKEEEKDNGCITNTVAQVTSTPNRISLTVNKINYTHDMILHTGEFNVSILSEDASFDTFRHFGFQSGRDIDKFTDYSACSRSKNGLYYITEGTNAWLSAKVIQTVDLGTHTMFIADVVAGDILSDVPSVTYTYYQKYIKPAPQTPKSDKVTWVCKICGYVYEGEDIPDDFICPICKHGAADFEKVME
nr:flavin reductase [uncultured Anaerobutyricum sp.]